MTEINSSILVSFLHFVVNSDEDASIECNFCSAYDYVFSDYGQLKTHHDWIAMAYQHVSVHHKKMLKEAIAKTV